MEEEQGKSTWIQAAWQIYLFHAASFSQLTKGLQRNQLQQHPGVTQKGMRDAYVQIGGHPLLLSPSLTGLISPLPLKERVLY